ncbi:MAG: hypothetical protein HRU12_13255, partial [Phaeodactylibacter sp.]|nr:hypothetical protein [Phaeodactylibacter sp.]
MNVRLAFFCLSFWMVLGSNGFAQDFCSSFTVTVSEDTTICEPSSPVQLSASFSNQPFFVEWSPASGLDNPLSAQPIATTPTTETYTVTAQAISENLIFNGDFELGGLGFTTDYNIASGGPNGPLHNEGEYLVSDNPNATHQDFADCGDHTLGTGNMMVVNSSDQQNDIWCQVISVEPGENYAFSAWVASVTSENPANLQFSFDGNLLGNTVEAPEETCVWTPFFATWSSGTATDVEICIANVNNESTGNDFAIDDIRFGPICEADASVTITVGEAPLPVPEVDCNATANSIALSWASVAGASSYSITVLDAAPGVFTSDTSYLITGLSELQQVNYELFAVSADGCSSQVFSGSCFSLECPEYSLTLDGDNEICEGDSLTLTLEITTSGSGPFSVGYEFNGLANTLQGLQPGTNTLSLPVPIGGTLSLSALTDESAPSCTFNGTFPSLSFTVIPGGNAGVGAGLTFC